MSAAILLFHPKEETNMTKISSGLRTLFLVHFVLGLIFGLLYLFIPGVFMGWLGVSLKDEFAYRTAGAAVLAFAVSSWLCYKAAEWERVKIVVLAEIVWAGLVALLSLYGLLFAGVAAAFWINVIIMAGFAAAFAYFYIRK
jgi:hypothetical protein